MVLQKRDEILHILQENIHMERNKMKHQVNRHRFEHTFQVGDMVFIHLYHYKQSSFKLKGCQKLAPNFYGPYKVLQNIRFVAYKLELPPSSHVHPIFHVSCLNKFIGTSIRAQIILPELDNEGSIILESDAILNKRTRHLRSRSITEVLIQRCWNT